MVFPTSKKQGTMLSLRSAWVLQASNVMRHEHTNGKESSQLELPDNHDHLQSLEEVELGRFSFQANTFP